MPLQSSLIRHPTRRVPATIGAAARRTSSTSSDRSCDRIHHRCPGSTSCSRSQTPGSLNESEPASSRPSCNHCGAAQVRACTPLVIDPIGTSSGSNPVPQLVEHGPAHAAVQQRDAVGPLRQPQPHVRHVELGRIVLGAERDDPFRRHARQQRAPSPSPGGRRSSAAPSRSGSGRYRQAPGCGW